VKGYTAHDTWKETCCSCLVPHHLTSAHDWEGNILCIFRVFLSIFVHAHVFSFLSSRDTSGLEVNS